MPAPATAANAASPTVKREPDASSVSAPATKRARAVGDGSESSSSDATANDELNIWTRSSRDLLHADEEQSQESGEKRIDDYLSRLFF